MTDPAARALARRLLVRHEGIRLRLYRCTAGKLTIGIGHNVEDRGISRRVAEIILDEDLEVALADLRRVVPDVERLDPVRLAALWDWSFNLGARGLATFERQTLPAIRRRDWPVVGRLLRRSKWARDVGTRAERVIRMLETGVAPAAGPGEG